MKKILISVFLFTSLLYAQIIEEPAQLLAESAEGFSMPKISPDGKMAAFGDLSHNGIFIVNYDGTGLKRISEESAAGWNLQWSPNSDYIASRINRWNGKERLTAVFLFDLNGGEENLSGLRNEISMPAFSEKGGKVVWENEESVMESFQIFSADEDRIFFNTSNKIIKEDEVQLLEGSGEFLFVSWSPDYSRAAVSSAGSGVVIIDFENGTTIDLGTGESPCWLDNNHLVVMEVKDDGQRILSSDILLFNYEGRLISNLTNDFEEPAFYPSGNREGKILFSSESGKIYKMKVRLKR
jgi:WD40 repeat protein